MNAKGLLATYRGTAKLSCICMEVCLPSPSSTIETTKSQTIKLLFIDRHVLHARVERIVFSLNLEMWKTGSRDWSSENLSPFWLRRDPGAHGSNPFISQMREERAREERFTQSGSAKWHLEPQLSDSQAAMFSTLQRNRAHWLAHISCQYFVVE